MTAKGSRDCTSVLLATLLFMGIVQGQMLTYNSTTKQIHFRCPRRPDHDGQIMFIQLARVSYPAQALVNWTLEHGPAGDETKLNIVNASYPYKLEAIMNHVTYKDSTTYRCYVQRDGWLHGTYEVKEDETFTYEGEVTVPVTEKRPLKSRYQVGDIVTFTCRALIGMENNTFIWESRLPRERNFSVVKEEGDPSTKIKQKKEQKPTCDWEAETRLVLELSAADDGRELRCRLKHTSHTGNFIVAVKRPHSARCTCIGEVTVPVTEKRPLKSRYQVGDIVTFTCRALIGMENNTFIWESRLPRERNFSVVKEEGDPSTKIKQKTEQKPTCDWEAETRLVLELSAADDGREWRCRLKHTNHTGSFTVAVKRPHSARCTCVG